MLLTADALYQQADLSENTPVSQHIPSGSLFLSHEILVKTAMHLKDICILDMGGLRYSSLSLQSNAKSFSLARLLLQGTERTTTLPAEHSIPSCACKAFRAQIATDAFELSAG